MGIINKETREVTEYTVGPNGDERMPATLPPDSGYTYAMELSADEALGAEQQLLSPPTQRHARLLAEGNHNVCEAILEINRINEGVTSSSQEFPVCRKRALPFCEYPEIRADVEIGA